MSSVEDAFANEGPARKVQVLIVVLLLAFGAAIAWGVVSPPHTDYVEAAKVTEVASVAGSCRMSVEAFVSARKAFPGNAIEAGCWEQPTPHSSGPRVSGGRIDVTIRRIHLLDGKVLSLQATTDAAGTRLAKSGEPVKGWRCSTSAKPEAYIYLAASCRQPPLSP